MGWIGNVAIIGVNTEYWEYAGGKDTYQVCASVLG